MGLWPGHLRELSLTSPGNLLGCLQSRGHVKAAALSMWLSRSLPTKHIPPALDALPNNTWRIDGLPLRKQRLGTEGVLSPCGERRDEDLLLEVVVAQMREVENDVVVWTCLPSRPGKRGAPGEKGCRGCLWVGGGAGSACPTFLSAVSDLSTGGFLCILSPIPCVVRRLLTCEPAARNLFFLPPG